MNKVAGINVDRVQTIIADTCKNANRDKGEITIVGVTKYTDANGIISCVEAGINDIGENKAQDAIAKIDELPLNHKRNIKWHFIGHLQTNKVKYIVPHFSLIHSLDRLSLAKEINKQAIKLDITVECLIQVNVSGEQTKYGVAINEALEFARNLEQYERIKIVGLMTMAPYFNDPELARPVFSRLRCLKEEIAQLSLANYDMKHLSMGMSNDFVVAIEEGATIVRLGSILFNNN
ncbi:YggS family pyridoxal phosphate-dependent enzyme [Desulfuribacillus alkaliarsenatis]|nr:YggS family pyridoxal phosphate-dependent enzyme [Desulfuribacillus alkaliarsenatis]